MKAKICDRCGALYRVADVREREDKTYTVVCFTHEADRPRPRQRVMDLCDGCQAALARWAENREDGQDGQD